jgi:hypothetical protein
MIELQTLLALPRAIIALSIKARVFSMWLAEPCFRETVNRLLTIRPLLW